MQLEPGMMLMDAHRYVLLILKITDKHITIKYIGIPEDERNDAYANSQYFHSTYSSYPLNSSITRVLETHTIISRTLTDV